MEEIGCSRLTFNKWVLNLRINSQTSPTLGYMNSTLHIWSTSLSIQLYNSLCLGLGAYITLPLGTGLELIASNHRRYTSGDTQEQ